MHPILSRLSTPLRLGTLFLAVVVMALCISGTAQTDAATFDVQADEFTIELLPQPDQSLLELSSFPTVTLTLKVAANGTPYGEEVLPEQIVLIEDSDERHPISAADVEQIPVPMRFALIYDLARGVDRLEVDKIYQSQLDEPFFRHWEDDRIQVCATDYERVCFDAVEVSERSTPINQVLTSPPEDAAPLERAIRWVLSDVSRDCFTPVIVILKARGYEESPFSATLINDPLFRQVPVYMLDFEPDPLVVRADIETHLRETGGGYYAAYADEPYAVGEKISSKVQGSRQWNYEITYRSRLFPDREPHELTVKLVVDGQVRAQAHAAFRVPDSSRPESKLGSGVKMATVALFVLIISVSIVITASLGRMEKSQ